MDPMELRLKNLLSDGDVLPNGRSLERVRCRETLQAVANKAGWGRGNEKSGVGHGIGICFRPVGIWGVEEANVEMGLSEDGRVKIVTTIPDTGSGTHTLLSQIAAEVLTIAPKDIQIIVGDTGTFETDAEPGGSKITMMTGHAVLAVAEEMRERMKYFAASLMNLSSDNVKLEKGHFSATRPSKKSIPFEEVAYYTAKRSGGLHIRKSYQPKERFRVVSFFAQVAEVQVDRKTGTLKVRRIVSAHDVGTIINPLTHQGQIEGGVIQGLGFATMEEEVTENGKILTLNLGDYRIPCVRDVPELKTVLVEDRAGPGPFAAKHIGENSIVPTAAAIANALDNAVGVRIFDLPLTAEKIYFALHSTQNT